MDNQESVGVADSVREVQAVTYQPVTGADRIYASMKESFPDSVKIVDSLVGDAGLPLDRAILTAGTWEYFVRNVQFYLARRTDHPGCSFRPVIEAAKVLARQKVLKHLPRLNAVTGTAQFYFSTPGIANTLTGRTYTDTPRLRDMSFEDIASCRHMEDDLVSNIVSSYGE